MKTLLNDGWLLSQGEADCFRPIFLPHDWLISDTKNLHKSGIGLYKRELDTGLLADGQRLFICFDGVYMDSSLSVNGRVAGEWKYGYTAFSFDITDFLERGKPNELLLKVDYKSPSGRWYTGAGIYRDVHLVVKNACHFALNGINITTRGLTYSVTAEVETNGKPYEILHTLVDASEPLEFWDTTNPKLYTLRSELIVDGCVMDTEDTCFGFRDIAFDTDKGFFLNGRRVRLDGVCLHHDLGALGSAVHKDAIRRQLMLFQEMGVNAFRTAHNPPAKVFMELCDEMGMLVVSEILDIWTLPKSKYDYARFFDEWIERDVASWIRRDRNHPSVIMWSVGNEIYDTHADAERGSETLRRLCGLVRLHDPELHAPITLCSNYMPWENTQKCTDIIKLAGYNYAEYLYDKHHAEHPDWVIYGSETCSTVQSRGVYHFPLAKSVLADDDLQCSTLGNSSTSWGAKSVEDCVLAVKHLEYSPGQFIWSGQDYIGEPTPYHTKNAYLGHVDTAGFWKDTAYIIQAAWSDKPMVHLFPYWDFSPGQLIDVRVATNQPSVELFLNGVSLGTKELNGMVVADWTVPFEPGELRAVAGGIESVRHSFGDASGIATETQTVGELEFVTIMVTDKDGHIVENANCRVTVNVENGTLLGLDNGDSTDYDQYQNVNNRRLFNGKLLAIVTRGSVVSTVIDTNDIPVRKVELHADGYKVTARILPENATYHDLHWRLTDAVGIDSPLGSLDIAPDGLSAVVLPKADGEVYIRCGVKNGLDHISLYTAYPIKIDGFGQCFLDPYGFISGGLYSHSNVTLTNGNERGVATRRDGVSHVCFTDINFGGYGSDEITLGLFPLSRNPLTFEIWEGLPETGEHLLDAYYDKGSVWNTYIDVTYKLPKRLRGITTLSFVFREKVHIKGFSFTKKEKAFDRLAASENDGIYGDSFTIDGGAVTGIGNNVSILYKDMDFGADGTEGLTLCLRSARERNSIQLSFGDTHTMVELPRADEYTELYVPLGMTVTGRQDVHLLFLPGCELDLMWIQFENTNI